MIRSVLIPVDLSPNSERVVERAALLPFTKTARVSLLHVVPKLLPRGARQRAESDARKALEDIRRRLARELPRTAELTTVVKTGTPTVEIARRARSVKAELLVMGRVGRRALRELFIGSTAERVIRQAGLPVLVVRLPARSPYQRPLFALDDDLAAQEILAFGFQMIPAPRPPLALVHAYDPPIHGLIYPSLSQEESKEHRRHYQKQAVHRIASMMSLAQLSGRVPGLEEVSWRHYVRYGSPRTVIPKTVTQRRADLLVLGTHGRSGVAHAMLGTVAGDVLREVPCDVLVVPPHQERGERAPKSRRSNPRQKRDQRG
ncbi:universal stress protein [Archangium lansingense]|uniref:Universal stress protein n=1 Tax=Archangium lansingense TaxID=2995310 RepID=A0ABT4AHS4_9BACT|nr:universal stress protein [Archangium lansinium]MCY1081225.1 universal stress protein [Archangium lansinium]